jgi:hypothetical protein
MIRAFEAARLCGEIEVSVLFPDAVQRAGHKGVYARLRGLCGAVLRRAGIVPDSEFGTIPGQQRITKGVLRCAREKDECCSRSLRSGRTAIRPSYCPAGSALSSHW